MSEETKFFVYLLEHYAASKGRLAPDVLRRWDELGITDLVYDMYEIYHVERLENAYDDIDALIEEAGAARIVGTGI
mgnify:CR=1 FL=1